MATNSLESHQQFLACIKDCDGNVETLKSVFGDTPGNEMDKKSILEQAFRDVLREFILSIGSTNIKLYTELVMLSIECVEQDICYHSIPFILLSDVLDCLTLDVCEQLFEFVEGQVATWTKPNFYSSGKILLLRMCNDLLRRLSAAQNTVFCGRIQLFLARLFPLSEKSALNLMSHFNLENVTAYNKEAGLSEVSDDNTSLDSEAMEIVPFEESVESSAPIDYILYQKLWALQDIFHNPTQCYSAEQWKLLTENATSVLQAFSSYKLEDVASSSSWSKKKARKEKHRSSVVDYRESHYFAKFLTSEKLMNLQLQDCHFRRHILIQLLVLFQYMSSDVKFKTSSQVMSDSQAAWIKETSEEVYKLLEETPPNGKEFATYIERVLKREKNWIAWKNDGCPSFEKQVLSGDDTRPNLKKQHLGERVAQNSRVEMGNPELSRLWNLCPDNLQACRMKSRMFTPDMKTFLEEPVEQADPEAKIEADYKMVNNANFTWQALRLLSQGSSHFFQNTTAQIKQLPEYLEHVIVQTGKDLHQQTATTQEQQ